MYKCKIRRAVLCRREVVAAAYLTKKDKKTKRETSYPKEQKNKCIEKSSLCILKRYACIMYGRFICKHWRIYL